MLANSIAVEAGIREANYWRSWFDAVSGIPGNPFGIDVRGFGAVMAIRCDEIPRSEYNRVFRLSDNDAGCVMKLMQYYAERMTPFRIDLVPDWASSEVLDQLDRIGFRPSDFQTVLAGKPLRQLRKPPRGVVVQEVGSEDLDLFCRLFEEAYYGLGQPPRLRIFRETSIRYRHGDPRWRFFMTSVDGVPAGGGALFLDGETATLAGGATLPPMRGRGCQSLLLQRRLDEAAAAGCEIVFGRSKSRGVSQHNMQKAGLTAVYTKSIWEHRWG